MNQMIKVRMTHNTTGQTLEGWISESVITSPSGTTASLWTDARRSEWIVDVPHRRWTFERLVDLPTAKGTVIAVGADNFLFFRMGVDAWVSQGGAHYGDKGVLAIVAGESWRILFPGTNGNEED